MTLSTGQDIVLQDVFADVGEAQMFQALAQNDKIAFLLNQITNMKQELQHEKDQIEQILEANEFLEKQCLV